VNGGYRKEKEMEKIIKELKIIRIHIQIINAIVIEWYVIRLFH